MATESEKKTHTKETMVTFDKRHLGYCGSCLYTWCILKSKVNYCSFRYKGELIFICDSEKCKTK
ncbi:MAG: hypothetical protein HZR80_06850 [Candidatus Heimdallarchaeota archaeon]